MKSLLIGLLATLILADSAHALLVVCTDETSFLVNSGTTSVYDFESDAVGVIKPSSYSSSPTAIQDFGDFSIDATGSNIYLAEVRQLTDGGNKDIYVNTMSNGDFLNIIFDMDVSAFGFDWIGEGNQSYDYSIFSLLGTTWTLGNMGQSGFFGLIETEGTISAGTAFSFGQLSSNWSGVSFDNLVYSSADSESVVPGPAPAPAPVPEPSTILLLGSGLLGLVWYGRKRKKA
jgi:hypothetical protein